MSEPNIIEVKQYFIDLQAQICGELEALDGKPFLFEDFNTTNGGISRPRVLEDGRYLEKAAVNFTHSKGTSLPKAASARNPELQGKSFEALAISVIVHPKNPYVPTFHANLRFFLVNEDQWHFGGGFDLTPYYPFPEDVLHWHRTAAKACSPFGSGLYKRLKGWCDDYFFLQHRKEPRGVGGIFFDDWNETSFESSLAFVQNVGNHILPAYLPIIKRRKDIPFGSKEEEFMLYRRGRYAEFNLVIDRGTKYGLESGRRIESVLASMPPRAIWKYDWKPKSGSPEAKLYEDYLRIRDWIHELN
ncbi:MAG: oxygen-dependent coproporphyrinogen oxidase [Gammaproteobacteria bacterium TMED1]|nr:MAG: oxygen-dependent coproporphyrinogen oxidase [Gammaproteobacteria bacterium TMED1]|tara:strand:- start:198 stop:1103 length:906 start_codon:yes stop_codon:yes gene_type:complete